MEALLVQLRRFLDEADAGTRRQALDTLRELQLSVEGPYDTLQRFAGLHLEIAVARIGEDLQIFQKLAAQEEPMSAAALSAPSGAAPVLMSRILRYLAATGMIREVGPDAFVANARTKTLAQPGFQGGVYHFFDNCGPVFQAFPDFLKEHKYQDVDDATTTAFQKAFATNLPAFAWLPTQPERFAPLQQVMTVQGAADATWFTVFPFEKELGSFGGSHVLVDVGGGLGHQCTKLLLAYPQLSGKLVLQDLSQTLDHLPPVEGVEAIAHNFFQPQPIHGARFYYMRNVMHDWPDQNCVEILRQLIVALGPESQILIDDMVLPDSGVHWQAATIDLTMMSSLGARERTRTEWGALLEKAGLRILRIDIYMPLRQDSIIQAVPK